MRIVILFAFLLGLTACAKVETASEDITNRSSPTPSPTIPTEQESFSLLKPVSPHVKLTSKQKRYLNETLPSEIRKILEQAEIFELLAEVRSDEKYDRDPMGLNPNRIVRVIDERQKREILEAFFSDAASETPPAVCFEPHHRLRATKGAKTIEIDICFMCSRFEGVGDISSVSGTIVREGRRSEKLFEEIVEKQSVELNQ